MNNILELRGKRFVQASRGATGGGVAMNGKQDVSSEGLESLINQLKTIKDFWDNENRYFDGVLINVVYNKIAAKSNRISGLFKGDLSNSAIVGAKFNDDSSKHIITYYVEIDDLVKSIQLLSNAKKLLEERFGGRISKTVFDNEVVLNKITFNKYFISKSSFKKVIADASYIEKFDDEIVSASDQYPLKNSIITLYDTKSNIKELLADLGIDLMLNKMLDDHTVFLDSNQLDLLLKKAPYLVAMATVDLSALAPTDFIDYEEDGLLKIPPPEVEPTIGVIDTLFDSRVYFKDWVDYHDMVDDSIPKDQHDYKHGTAIASIIVDGERLNPWLRDGCGRFKVRHFGVATNSHFSSFTIIKKIRKIIGNNRDIKVWNISLGSNEEINDNFISAEAAVLDQIQHENDVIFVIAGTNKPSIDVEKIGSPADSINSLVVNSVTKKGLSTNYTRKGLALSFFAKPDVSYFGGSEEEYIQVCEPLGIAKVAGTSFAAPWIARKLSFLIDIIGLNREVAKALVIDSARGWNDKPTPEEVATYGHGIVPISIGDIIQTKEDEIRFVVSDVSEKWNTYSYHFPVPLSNNQYPYVARATMCYFPMCNRMQGVDYTNTELNLHFGRIKDDGSLYEINDDTQNRDDSIISSKHYLLEGEARKKFRKWDNVKYISQIPKDRMRPKKSYSNKNWGMEIKTSNRLNPEDGVGVRFGVVVTLKEINGVNRIDEFIKNCTLNGWLVNEIDVTHRIEIHEKISEEIEFS